MHQSFCPRWHIKVSNDPQSQQGNCGDVGSNTNLALTRTQWSLCAGFLMRCMSQGSAPCHSSLWRSREADEEGEKNGSFYPPHGCLEARSWSKHSTCVCVCVCSRRWHLGICIRCYCSVSHICFLFWFNFKVGHRNRPEGGCLKTDDDSFTPHVHVKNLNLCEQLSPRVVIFFCSTTAQDCRKDVAAWVYF